MVKQIQESYICEGAKITGEGALSMAARGAMDGLHQIKMKSYRIILSEGSLVLKIIMKV